MQQVKLVLISPMHEARGNDKIQVASFGGGLGMHDIEPIARIDGLK